MNRQSEFVSDLLHSLAQPVTALRATVELGLSKELNKQAARLILEDCLHITDLLMRDLAVLREISGLDEAAPRISHDGRKLLQECAEEMAVVAEADGISLRLTAEPTEVLCDQSMFQRGIFVLLDEIIACAPRGGEISLSLHNCENGANLVVRGDMPKGQRWQLFRKLMRCAGASGINCAPGILSITFDKPYRQPRASNLADKRVLTSH